MALSCCADEDGHLIPIAMAFNRISADINSIMDKVQAAAFLW